MGTFRCSGCGEEIVTDDTETLAAMTCRACQRSSAAAPGAPPDPPAADAGRCGFCLSPMGAGEAVTVCPACHASYHEECWQENGGCAVYGCSQVPLVEPRRSVEIPVSYWGQENKPCPACGKEILAAAVRCRFCGATFASARPEDAASFAQRSEQQQRLPRVRRTIVWIFVLSVLPCSAPFGGLWGLVWYPMHRSDLEALPSLYPALCKIGIGVGLGQTLILALMALIYATVNGR